MPELSSIADGLYTAFPDLADLEPVRILDTGFGSSVIETAGARIFRIARHRRATEGQRREARFLPALARQFPVSVPEPRWHTGPTTRFPFGVIGYYMLPVESRQPNMLRRS